VFDSESIEPIPAAFDQPSRDPQPPFPIRFASLDAARQPCARSHRERNPRDVVTDFAGLLRIGLACALCRGRVEHTRRLQEGVETMRRRATRGLIVAGIVLLAFVANRAEAAGGSQDPALRRVAKQIGLALDGNNKTDIRLVLDPAVSGDVADLILARFREALEADPRVEQISDDATFTARIGYLRSDLKVCLEVVLENGRNQSLGKFSANFDLELPPETENVGR
jgi:hypothetical protein